MGSELAHVAAAPFHGWGLIRLLCHTGLGELSFLLGSWNLTSFFPSWARSGWGEGTVFLISLELSLEPGEGRAVAACLADSAMCRKHLSLLNE